MANNRLVFIVEGDSELAFVGKKLIPYLYENGASGWAMNAQKITTNRKKNAKGENVNYANQLSPAIPPMATGLMQ